MRRKKFKKSKFITGAILICIFGGFYLFSSKPEAIKKIVKETINYTKLKVSGSYSAQLKDKMSAYINTVERTGITPCRDESDIKSRRNLYKLEAGSYYSIARLDYSHAYLSKKGKALLERIEAGFGEKIKTTDLRDSRFIVTSLTRTKENVRRLRRNNGNASDRSAHMYGGCFVITYARFENDKKNLTANDIYRLKETLAQVIFELKEKKKCWAITEKRQPCYHIVAR
jgi:hypothetical protein